MVNKKSKFEDFRIEKLSDSQQKVVRGGDGEGPVDPTKLKGVDGNP